MLMCENQKRRPKVLDSVPHDDGTLDRARDQFSNRHQLGLLQVLWALVSGQLLCTRGALIPALAGIG